MLDLPRGPCGGTPRTGDVGPAGPGLDPCAASRRSAGQVWGGQRWPRGPTSPGPDKSPFPCRVARHPPAAL